MSEPRFLDPYEDIQAHRNKLPHWQQTGSTYFITFRQADSIPEELASQWREERAVWLIRFPKPWAPETEREYHQRFSREFEAWMDQGHGTCRLREPAAREFLRATLRFRDGSDYEMHSWVIMPNHVHVLATLADGRDLETVVGAWKSISARRINELLGRSGTFWQEDYFDRLIRDEEHFLNCVRYVRRNPQKAGLRSREFELFEAEAVQGLE